MNRPSLHIRDAGLMREIDAEYVLLDRSRPGHADWLVIIKLAEWEELRDHFGPSGYSAVRQVVGSFITGIMPDGNRLIETHGGEKMVMVSDSTETELERLLTALARKIVAHPFVVAGETVRVTPAIGYVALRGDLPSRTGLRRARAALDYSLAHLDLKPTAFSDLLQPPSPLRAWMLRLEVRRIVRFAFHVGAALFLALVVPFFIYMSLPVGVANLASIVMFVLTVIVLVTTATLINIEGLLSLQPEELPVEPQGTCPPATAIIAAYLPNEAASVVSTLEAVLAVDYPGRLQIILAYNTPHDLPIEDTLRQMARQNPRIVLLRVEGSTSKAQNINAALSLARGEFTAIFDADHHPAPDSFCRAWRWLSDSADVVQGHCVVRNGSATLLSRIVAVEFEQIYAVAHPGSTRLRGYGIFGGSNGYWRTSLLNEIRMRASMLTEDIDSSMRAVCEGRRIVSDPGLISTELAPVTLRSLTHQRLRWNQGWFQVSLLHLKPMLRSKKLSLRQKIGTFYLLGWREMFPWFSLQVFPVLAYWVVQAGSIDALDWKVPILLLATVYVLITGPLQTLIAYANAAPNMRKHGGWFLAYLLLAILYSEYMTLLARVAHLRQLFGESEWRVTPRSVEDTHPGGGIPQPFKPARTAPLEKPPEAAPEPVLT